MAAPYLKLYKIGSDGNADASTELDITTYILDGGLTIEHEDLDTDGSGREPLTGVMVRERVAKKHTITVKLRRISASHIAMIYDRLFGNDKKFPFFKAAYVHPCDNDPLTASSAPTFYASSFNYGAQRYKRESDTIFYDGATFKIIQR